MSQTPYINLIENFDALDEYTIDYTYLGSQRITTNQVQIREAVSGSEPVYDRTSTRFDKEHVVPEGALENGKSYWARVRVQLDESTWSEWSAETEFMTLRTPTLVWDSLDEQDYVYNNDIMMAVVYRQEQGERVEQYRFSLLDQNKHPVTDMQFPWRKPDAASPNILTERLSDLVKGRLYYVGIRIQTRNGINYYETHELIPHFVTPTIDNIIEVKNNGDAGQVLVQAYLKQILGSAVKPHIMNDDGSYAPDDNSNRYTYMNDSWIIIPPEQPLLYENLGMARASDWVMKSWQQNVLNGVMFDFSEYADFGGIHIKFVKHDDYITVEKEFKGVKSRTKSNTIEGLGLKPFYMYVRVIEHRIMVHIEEIDG